MKKNSILQLIVGIVVTCVSGFSFVDAKLVQIKANTPEDIAKYCETDQSICGTAPEELTLLMDFVREMTNSIKTMGTNGDYLGQYVSPNRFIGNVFTPPQQTGVSRLARNIAQKAKFGLATTAIFSSPVNFAGGKDIVGGTVLLSKNKVFLRDAKLVEELESLLNDKKYELGLGGGWREKIIPENRAIMQNIIKKYIAEGLFTVGDVYDGAVYNNITSLLTQMLSSAKTFLYFDTTSQFNDIRRGGSDGIKISFATGFMSNLSTKYSCARGINNPCDLSNTFFDNMKSLRLNSKSSFTGSIKVITSARDKLMQTVYIQEQDDKFKEREADLLQSIYGTTKKTPGTLIDINYAESSDSKKTVGDIGKGIATAAVRSWNFTKSIFQKKEEIEKTKIIILPSTDNFTALMNSYISDVFVSQKIDSKLAIFAEVKDVTRAFKVLGEQVYKIKTEILGGKEKNNSLLSNLGAACELQCGRGGVFGKCR